MSELKPYSRNRTERKLISIKERIESLQLSSREYQDLVCKLRNENKALLERAERAEIKEKFQRERADDAEAREAKLHEVIADTLSDLKERFK
jgi:uncharacterized protein (DUF3084 family)